MYELESYIYPVNKGTTCVTQSLTSELARWRHRQGCVGEDSAAEVDVREETRDLSMMAFYTESVERRFKKSVKSLLNKFDFWWFFTSHCIVS